jgi:hypothetical protein
MLALKSPKLAFAIMTLTTLPSLQGVAGPLGSTTADFSILAQLQFKGTNSAHQYIPFSFKDVLTGAPTSGTFIDLGDGRQVNAYTYLRELNAAERKLNAWGASLRNDQSELGTVARVQLPSPKLSSVLPTRQQQDSNDSSWSHELKHTLALAKSSGRVTQKSTVIGSEITLDRTTTQSVEGRFLDAKSPSIAQFVQRVVRSESGEEQRETQVYINGRQVFRRGRVDSQEVRVWKTAFDVPVKSVTIPVGPGSVDAKLGIRGGVNLDLELNPTTGPNATPQIALDFKPQIIADGYISGATTPTNIGEAGIEGAITLADNTLKVNGTAAVSLAKGIDLRQLTVDNVFAGFNGRVYGYASIKMPGRNADGKDNKRFEKEFYKWDGIKVENRIYEYKAPEPQPRPQPPAL